MGSYLTIVNDTNDEYLCKLSADTRAIKFVNFAALGIGAFSAILGAISFGHIVSKAVVGNNAISLFGVSSQWLEHFSNVIGYVSVGLSSAAAVSSFSVEAVQIISIHLSKNHYISIGPNESHRYGKFTLALWCQSICVRSVVLHETAVRVDSVYMRPIFSGILPQSNKNHSIQTWISRKGLRSQIIAAQNALGNFSTFMNEPSNSHNLERLNEGVSGNATGKMKKAKNLNRTNVSSVQSDGNNVTVPRNLRLESMGRIYKLVEGIYM
uniref:Uncharacterized protein AlNc14C620G12257 n=1 Tax=Albugo laibachii Nc14 TaxID=890382 RepID=F0X1G6_9STRA|nr:conserved hypothetical protein [Albugo laibachii Nc14]|eukprot:CCA27652.1 conserved hypothetical protein [Albugo laibachii Nc14]